MSSSTAAVNSSKNSPSQLGTVSVTTRQLARGSTASITDTAGEPPRHTLRHTTAARSIPITSTGRSAAPPSQVIPGQLTRPQW